MKGTEFLYYMQEKVGVETENEAIGMHDHIIRSQSAGILILTFDLSRILAYQPNSPTTPIRSLVC